MTEEFDIKESRLRQRIKELEDELAQLRLLVYAPSEENDDDETYD